ncbi:hypothetical protein LINPERPRIM_LOCUS6648 [Linum perenne]
MPRSNIAHELRVQSDHNPIILKIEGEGSGFEKRGFYYEIGWQGMEGYEEMVKRTWNRGADTNINLSNCSRFLQRWKK